MLANAQLMALGWVYLNQSRFADAERSFERLLKVTETALGSEHPETSDTLFALGRTRVLMGRPAEAEWALRRALTVREKHLGPDDPSLAPVIAELAVLRNFRQHNEEAEQPATRALALAEKGAAPFRANMGYYLVPLATIYRERNRDARAESLLKAAIALPESASPRRRRWLANALEAYADLLGDTDRHAEASEMTARASKVRETLGKKPSAANDPDRADNAAERERRCATYYAKAQKAWALQIIEGVLGAGHLDTQEYVRCMARVRRVRGKYEESLDLLQSASRSRESAGLGSDVVSADIMADLSRSHLGMGNYAAAEQLARQALDIAKESFGPEARLTADFRAVLAEAYQARGRYRKALELEEWIHARKTERPADRDVALADSWGSIASIRFDLEDYRQAETLAEKALAVYERRFGPESHHMRWLLLLLGETRSRMGEPIDGERLARRAMALEEKVYGRDHPGMAGCHHVLADACERQGKLAVAETHARRAVEITEQAGFPDDPALVTLLKTLATVHRGQAKLEQAEAEFKRALAIAQRSLRPQHPDVIEVLDAYAELLTQTNRNAEAERIMARARAIRASQPRTRPTTRPNRTGTGPATRISAKRLTWADASPTTGPA